MGCQSHSTQSPLRGTPSELPQFWPVWGSSFSLARVNFFRKPRKIRFFVNPLLRITLAVYLWLGSPSTHFGFFGGLVNMTVGLWRM